MAKQANLQELDFEIQFYEGLLKKLPDFPNALVAVGDCYTKRGLYDKGLEVDKKLAQLRPEDPFILYNLGCSYALLNQIDLAFRSIKKSVNCGYTNFVHMESDPDLDNLRKDLRFKRYFSRLKRLRSDSSKIEDDADIF